MKILFIGRYNPMEILTGSEKVAKRIFEQISKLNHETEFLTYFFKEGKKRKLQDVFIGMTILQEKPKVVRCGLITMLKYIFQVKPCIIHFITFERFFFPVLLMKKFIKSKLIYNVHGIYRFERESFYSKPNILSDLKNLTLEKMLFKKSDQLIFLSSQSIELAEKYYLIKKDKISIMPNGTSTLGIPPECKFDIKNNLKIVFYDSSTSLASRGLEELVGIIDKEFRTKICLTIIGEEQNKLNPRHLDLSYKNCLPEKELLKFLGSNHIYIDSLKFQTFSLMALEAMSAGLIVIVSSQSGISSYIKSGENGFIFDLQNPREIVEILQSISGGKYNLESISRNAIAAAKKLSWDKAAMQYLETYRDLLK